MTAARVRSLIAVLPDGFSEIYFHPATEQDALLRHLMPDYEHAGELAALLESYRLDGRDISRGGTGA